MAIIIIIIGAVVIGAIALPILYLSSRKDKGNLENTFQFLGIEQIKDSIWNRSDFHDTLIGSDTIGITLNVKNAVTAQDIDAIKKKMISRIKSGWGKI